jgi:hypothetical protein
VVNGVSYNPASQITSSGDTTSSGVPGSSGDTTSSGVPGSSGDGSSGDTDGSSGDTILISKDVRGHPNN